VLVIQQFVELLELFFYVQNIIYSVDGCYICQSTDKSGSFGLNKAYYGTILRDCEKFALTY